MYCRKPKRSLIFFVLLLSLIHSVSSLINLADIQCGKQPWKELRNPKIVSRHGSTFAGEYPWMVSIKYKGGDHFCGGFIINRRFILSAAHCFNSITERFATLDMMTVTVGEYHHFAKEQPEDSIDYDIDHLIHHPDYDMQFLSHDIVLLKLEKSLEWSSFVQPLCLTEKQDTTDNTYTSDKGTVAGWGQTGETKPASEVLRQATVSILENSTCQTRFRLALLKYVVNSFQVCAGELFGGVDTCMGDSGGPLMVRSRNASDDYMSALGIASMGKGCGRIGLPGVYTRIPSYVEWIQAQIKAARSLLY